MYTSSVTVEGLCSCISRSVVGSNWFCIWCKSFSVSPSAKTKWSGISLLNKLSVNWGDNWSASSCIVQYVHWWHACSGYCRCLLPDIRFCRHVASQQCSGYCRCLLPDILFCRHVASPSSEGPLIMRTFCPLWRKPAVADKVWRHINHVTSLVPGW